MNWQALNPLRWASASKNGVAALWRRRPQMTRRRVAWGTAATMLLSGSSYYGYQKLQPDRTVARSAGAPGSVGEAASLVGTIQPIPDGGDPGVIPPEGPAPGSYGDPNATDPATAAAENGQGGAFGAGPPAVAYPPSDSSIESHAVRGGEGSVAQETGDTGQPEAGNPAAGDASEDGRGRVIAMNEGPIQMAVEAQPEGGENPGEVAPAADSGPPPPATFAADNPSPVPGGPPGQFPASSTATPTAPDTTSADLVPVPSRPQPAPPEEHVRLPAEAVPNLSPRDGVGGPRRWGTRRRAGDSNASPQLHGRPVGAVCRERIATA